MSERNSFVKKLLAFFIILLIFDGYWALTTRGTFSFRELPGFAYYDLLAESWLAGRLHLGIPVHPGRLKSPEPNDPNLPYPYIVDGLIWNGKYYIYHEPLPGVIHAIWMFATGLPCPTSIMILIFTMGTLLVLGWLLRFVQKSFFPNAPPWLFWYVWLSFAASAAQLYIVARPNVYDESISSGMFFVSLAAAVFFKIVAQDRSNSRLLLAGLFLGMGLACRKNLGLFFVGFMAGLLLEPRQGARSARSTLGRILWFSFPVAVFAAAMLAYNYARFGDPLNFGRRMFTPPSHDVYEYVIKMGYAFRLDHIPYNLYTYFLSLPEISRSWPFVIYPEVCAGKESGLLVCRESMASVLLLMPMTLLAIPFPSLVRKLRAERRLLSILAVCAIGSLAMFCLVLPFYWAVPRYLYEFTPLLFIIVFSNVASLWEEITDRGGKTTALTVALGLFFALNLIAGATLALNGFLLDASRAAYHS